MTTTGLRWVGGREVRRDEGWGGGDGGGGGGRYGKQKGESINLFIRKVNYVSW